MANLAAKRKLRNAARFDKNRHEQQRQKPPSVSHNIKVDTSQEDDPDGMDASTAYKLEEQRVKTEKDMVAVGNEALIFVYGYNPNLYEDVFALSPNASINEIRTSYRDQTKQLEHSLATVFTSDVPDDEINNALNESQMEAAIQCGMTSAHMKQMHPRNFMEVKMDALKRAYAILKDKQSRMEYDAVLLEFQESSRVKLTSVVEVDEDVQLYDVDRHIDYGENGDYSYDVDDLTEEDDVYEEDEQSSRTSVVSSVAGTTSRDKRYDRVLHNKPYNAGTYPQSPPQALSKHPWKQEQLHQQHSPRDPFDFDQQYHQSYVPESDNSILSMRSTRSFHVDLFDPFDLQGADQIDFNHLPMVDIFNPASDESIHTEDKRHGKSDDETVTVFLGPLPKANDDDDDITVGEVIAARERGEDVVLPRRTTPDGNDYTNMVDFVPRKKEGIKPKLQSLYQSMKRSVGGSSKGSRSIASDSAEFQSKGVRVMSVMSSKKENHCDDDPPQATKAMNVAGVDPRGPNLSKEEDDDDEGEDTSQIFDTSDDNTDDESVKSDFVSELTRDTSQQQGPSQPQQIVPSLTDLELETFLMMANKFRAMDEANSHKSKEEVNSLVNNSSDENTSMTQQNRLNVPTKNDCALSTEMSMTQQNRLNVPTKNDCALSTETKEDYVKQYAMNSLLSVDEDSEYEDDNKSILDEWVSVIDEIEEMFDESLESVSSMCSWE
jgi:curved DNA-binding protein CbpA